MLGHDSTPRPFCKEIYHGTTEAMENSVFPDKIVTTLMKMYLMNIFPILTGILQKKAAKGRFYLFALQILSKRP